MFERMPTGSLSVHVSQSLHVRANDIADTANFGVALNLVDGRLLLPEGIFDRLDRNIKPDLVPKLETVRNGFRDRIDTDRDALDLVIFNSIGQRTSREPDNSQRRSPISGTWRRRSAESI